MKKYELYWDDLGLTGRESAFIETEADIELMTEAVSQYIGECYEQDGFVTVPGFLSFMLRKYGVKAKSISEPKKLDGSFEFADIYDPDDDWETDELFGGEEEYHE